MYCDLCHVNLCKLCICDHISDEYDKHKIVPILERKKPSLMFPTCKIHSMKKCELQCKLCNVFICVVCLASSEHKGHKFSGLKDIYKTKQVDIKKQTEEMKKIFALTYEEIRNGLIIRLNVSMMTMKILQMLWKNKEENGTRKLTELSLR